MADPESSQPASESDAADTSQSSGMLDKAKQFLSMGGDKGKWTTAIIASVIVVVVFLFAGTAAWGLGLSFMAKSIAEPNNCTDTTASAGLPSAATSSWRTGIYTTQFGGCGKDGKECADSGDNCRGSGGVSTGCTAPTQLYASLPYSKIAAQCHGDINKCAKIEVLNPANNKSVVLAVVDSGPCNTSDKEYVLNGAEPQVRKGVGVGGCASQSHKAELDISPTAMKQLESDDFKQLNWRFTSAPVATGATGCATNMVTDAPGFIYKSDAYSAEQIDNYLKANAPHSPLIGKGAAFVASGKKYGVNPGFLLGITNSESSLGAQCNSSGNLLNGTNNAFGLTCGGPTTFCHFSSYEDGIDRAAKNVSSRTYTRLNGSIKEFGLKWCGYEKESDHPPVKLSDGSSVDYVCSNNDSNWAKEVQSIMDAIK
ncbi:MAG: glucosaminidase domain-containing protein [Candidatus Berkelbacteria bacterium]